MPSTNQTAADATNPRQRQTLKIVFLTLFLDLVGFSIIFPLFPAMLDYYLPQADGSESLLGQIIAPIYQLAESSGAANPQFMTAVLFGGLLGSLYSILQFLCAPLWGAYSDRVGRRKVLLLTTAGLALSYLVWFFAASFWVLILARILGGIMGGNLSVATAAVADVTSREKRSGGMAIVGIAFGLGFLIGPAVGGLCSLLNPLEFAPELERYGLNPFSFPALVSCVLSLLNLIWVLRRFEETLPESARGQQTHSALPVLQLFKSKSAGISRTNLIYLIFMFAFSGMEFTLTFLAVERFAFSPAQNGGMFVYIGFLLILVQGGIVRRMAPKLGEIKLAKTGLIFGILAFALLAFALKLSSFFIALAAMAFAIGLASPTLSALVSLYSSEQDQGRELGAFRSAGSLARAGGPLVAAIVYFIWGSQSAYLFGAAIILIPLALAYKLPQPAR